MNKESIYRIIGYRGEYTQSVKRALRKLLKEYHPDHQGDEEVYKLVNEVKKELEVGKVSFHIKKEENNSRFDDIDYDYCQEMADKCEKELKEIFKKLKEKQHDKNLLIDEYKKLNKKKIKDLGRQSSYNVSVIQNTKKSLVITIIALLIIFIIAVLKGNIFLFILFGICCMASILIMYKYFKYLKDISQRSESKVIKYQEILEKMNSITNNIQNMSDDILIIERKVKNIENDLRFYHNLLK